MDGECKLQACERLTDEQTGRHPPTPRGSSQMMTLTDSPAHCQSMLSGYDLVPVLTFVQNTDEETRDSSQTDVNFLALWPRIFDAGKQSWKYKFKSRERGDSIPGAAR